MKIKALLITSILLILFLNSGCASKARPIPPSIFQEKSIITPFEPVDNEADMLRRYLEIYKAYKDNLILLDAIENLNH